MTTKEYIKERINYYKQMVPEEKYKKAGLYTITVNGEVVYIGKSTDMQNRIANHLYHICDDDLRTPGDKAKYGELRRARFLGYNIIFNVLYYSIVEEPGQEQDDDIGKKEAIYINQYMPKLNRQVPSLDNYHSYKNKPYEPLNIQERGLIIK